MMLIIIFGMDVYIILFIYFARVARGQMMSSFIRVTKVSLFDYTDNVLAVYENMRSTLKCAAECNEDCFSFTFDPETKECKTYTKELCTSDANPSVVNMFVKKRPDLVNYPSDCSEVNTAYCSGVYRITPSFGLNYDVFCDMDTENGPWTVFQNRQDQEVTFYRTFEEYKKGFGDLNGNFWAGLEIIHQLTLKESILRIELVSWSGVFADAQYSEFSIKSESSGYQLSVAGFSGNVSLNAMSYHNGCRFSTYDSSDNTCATVALGGWWYRYCYDCNLNGPYRKDEGNDIYASMAWWKFYPGRIYVPLMKTKMLVKPSGV